MSFNEVSLNFPDQLCPHSKKKRLYFYDYGTPFFVDVSLGVSESGDSKVNFVPQRCFKCPNTDHTLAAQNPTLPLIPPNNYKDISEEPCLHVYMHNYKETQRLLRNLKRFVNYINGQRYQMRKVVKTQLRKINSLRDLIQKQPTPANKLALKNLVSSNSNHFYLTFFKKMTLSSWNVINNPTVIKQKPYNELYNGGCLAYQPSDQNEDIVVPFIAHPTGPNMSDIVFRNATATNGGSSSSYYNDDSDDDRLPTIMNRLESAKKTLYIHEAGDRIVQVDANSVQGFTFCAYRTKNSVSLLNVAELNLKNADINLSTKQTFTTDIYPTHVSISPYLAGEMVVTSNDGLVYLWSPDKMPRLVHSMVKDNANNMNCNVYASYCSFGSHPRSIILASDDLISMVDIRTPNSNSTALLHTDGDHFHSKEYITCYHRQQNYDNNYSYYHFFSTQNTIGLIDERYSNHLVLRWNHAFLTAPTLMTSSLKSVMGVPQERLLVAASQEHSEAHCFQYHTISQGFQYGGSSNDNKNIFGFSQQKSRSSSNHVQACGLPWKCSKPRDILAYSSYNGRDTFSKLFSQRLECPIIGLAILPVKNNSFDHGVSIVQLSSVGDLYYQDYYPTKKLNTKDKTFSAGPGSQDLTASPDYQEASSHWMNECYDLSIEDFVSKNRVEDESEKLDTLLGAVDLEGKKYLTSVDAESVFDDLKEINAPHPKCRLCSDDDDHDVDGDDDNDDVEAAAAAADGGDDRSDRDDDDSKDGGTSHCDDVICPRCNVSVSLSRDLLRSCLGNTILPAKHPKDANKLSSFIPTVDNLEPIDIDGKILLCEYLGGSNLRELLEERDKEINRVYAEMLKSDNEDDDDDYDDEDENDHDNDRSNKGDDGSDGEVDTDDNDVNIDERGDRKHRKRKNSTANDDDTKMAQASDEIMKQMESMKVSKITPESTLSPNFKLELGDDKSKTCKSTSKKSLSTASNAKNLKVCSPCVVKTVSPSPKVCDPPKFSEPLLGSPNVSEAASRSPRISEVISQSPRPFSPLSSNLVGSSQLKRKNTSPATKQPPSKKKLNYVAGF